MAPWAKKWQQAQGYRHRLRVMLGHDEIRVDEHVERYTRAQVAKMWKSYCADGMSAMDEKKATTGDITMQEVFGNGRPGAGP